MGGRWVAIDDEGTIAVDVLAWREIASVTDAADLTALQDQPRSERVGAAPTEPVAAVIMEASVFHTPDADLLVGDLIEEVVGAIDGSTPDSWGETEPLERRWDRAHLTRRMREGMPRTEIIRGSTPTGIRFVMSMRRTEMGVTESVRVVAPIGSWQEHSENAAIVAAEAVESLMERFVPIHAFATRTELDAGGALAVREFLPARPAALLLGPTLVNEIGLKAAEMEERFGAVRFGPRYFPQLLFRFGPGHEEAWRGLQEFVNESGFASLLTFEEVTDG